MNNYVDVSAEETIAYGSLPNVPYDMRDTWTVDSFSFEVDSSASSHRVRGSDRESVTASLVHSVIQPKYLV